jgi:5-formyltetrahydrofolate cyclo-ligase
MTDSLRDAKAVLRQELRHRRSALDGERRSAAAIVAAGHALEAVGQAVVVAAFRGVRDEIDTAPLIATLVERGVVVVLPRIVGRGMPLAFHVWRPGEPLEDAAMGVVQPPADSPALFPNVVIAPLLAFDGRGSRLGYGGGFYDRTLRALRRDRGTPAIGFAFELQRVEKVPVGPSDERLDLVATEAGLYDCRDGR